MVIRAGLHDNIFPPGMIPEDHQPIRLMVPSLRLDMAVEAFQDSSPLILVLLEVILFYPYNIVTGCLCVCMFLPKDLANR